jgi:RNA-directed DNA polymerase
LIVSTMDEGFQPGQGQGNPVLTRYADDFLLSTNGPGAEAMALRAGLQMRLAEWGPTLSPKKTLITHIDDGFGFLGFHARRYRKGQE